MKYYTWKLNWENGYGTDPTGVVNTDTTRVEPSFSIGDTRTSDGLIYCTLLTGSIEPETLTTWSVVEITAEQMLDAAKTLNAEAIMVDGIIKFPRPELV